jgi:hypothetical protein
METFQETLEQKVGEALSPVVFPLVGDAAITKDRRSGIARPIARIVCESGQRN